MYNKKDLCADGCLQKNRSLYPQKKAIFSKNKCSKEGNLILLRRVNIMSCKLCTHGSEARSLHRSNYHINRRLLKKLIKVAFVVLNSTQHASYSSTVQTKQKLQLPQRYL